jgi:hypothetical protein
MPNQFALYRYFDGADVLLYVGKSGDMAVRDSAHIRRSQWMQFAVRSVIERRGSAAEVGDAERTAIEAEHPVFNRQYNDTPAARERLWAYLEAVGRLDLMPARFRVAPGTDWAALAVAAEGDTFELVRAILTADTPDHAGVRLRTLAALEGHADLPRGRELERLASLARINRVTAYRAKKTPRRPLG